MQQPSATNLLPPYILGIDIGGTKTALVLGTLQAEVALREEFKTPADLPFGEAMPRLEAAIRGFLERCPESPHAISVAVGGPLDIERGILYAPPHLARWGEAHLKERLEQAFELPVFVEHDGNAGALAEFYFGAGRGKRNVIFLTMGTGLGAGLILDGAIYHGTTDAAGEVGHVRVAEDGPLEYGKAGSWEGYASGSGLAKLARLRHPAVFGEGVTPAEVIQRALAGEPEALAVVRESGEWLGKGLALLVDVLNPEVIIIGTLGVVLGERVLEPARRLMAQEALPISARACRLVPAQLGARLMDVGCLMAAYDARQRGKLSI